MKLCLIQAIKLTEHSNQMLLDRLSKENPTLISYLLGSYPNLKVKGLKFRGYERRERSPVKSGFVWVSRLMSLSSKQSLVVIQETF